MSPCSVNTGAHASCRKAYEMFEREMEVQRWHLVCNGCRRTFWGPSEDHNECPHCGYYGKLHERRQLRIATYRRVRETVVYYK